MAAQASGMPRPRPTPRPMAREESLEVEELALELELEMEVAFVAELLAEVASLVKSCHTEDSDWYTWVMYPFDS